MGCDKLKTDYHTRFAKDHEALARPLVYFHAKSEGTHLPYMEQTCLQKDNSHLLYHSDPAKKFRMRGSKNHHLSCLNLLFLTEERIEIWNDQCFAPWLNVKSTQPDGQLIHALLLYQALVTFDPEYDGIAYSVGGPDKEVLRFGPWEFCIITRFKFGDNGTKSKGDKHFEKDHLLLVDNFDCWNDYNWGTYLWSRTYLSILNVLMKKVIVTNKKLHYPLTGFVWAFKKTRWPTVEVIFQKSAEVMFTPRHMYPTPIKPKVHAESFDYVNKVLQMRMGGNQNFVFQQPSNQEYRPENDVNEFVNDLFKDDINVDEKNSYEDSTKKPPHQSSSGSMSADQYNNIIEKLMLILKNQKLSFDEKDKKNEENAEEMVTPDIVQVSKNKLEYFKNKIAAMKSQKIKIADS
ncbi:hypothetical protein E3N88_34955 [Mikania micrantha]|uniref:DUF1985 domain-containing protein n=1 Tax=Mikania micrantha TaxID=192012 RepID=A0A5N6LZM1_9ASTR|nr:hypothetical protein E3N88_34955 [Mikania micrantha]